MGAGDQAWFLCFLVFSSGWFYVRGTLSKYLQRLTTDLEITRGLF